MLNNLYGEDREDAIAAMNDDEAFDRWLHDFERKRQMESPSRRSGSSPSGSGGGGRAMSKEEYLANFDGILD